MNAFAWLSADMLGIDLDYLCHHLTNDKRVRPFIQRRRKFNKEKCLVICEEMQKLLTASHIREV